MPGGDVDKWTRMRDERSEIAHRYRFACRVARAWTCKTVRCRSQLCVRYSIAVSASVCLYKSVGTPTPATARPQGASDS